MYTRVWKGTREQTLSDQHGGGDQGYRPPTLLSVFLNHHLGSNPIQGQARAREKMVPVSGGGFPYPSTQPITILEHTSMVPRHAGEIDFKQI